MPGPGSGRARSSSPRYACRDTRHRAQGGQVRGHPLHVEQPSVDVLVGQQVDQPDQRHLRRVAARWNIDSPANSPPIATPYSPPASSPSRHASTECAQPSSVQLGCTPRRCRAVIQPAAGAGSAQRGRPPRRRRCRPGSRSRRQDRRSDRRHDQPVQRQRRPARHRRAPVHRRDGRRRSGIGKIPLGTPPAGCPARGRPRSPTRSSRRGRSPGGSPERPRAYGGGSTGSARRAQRARARSACDALRRIDSMSVSSKAAGMAAGSSRRGSPSSRPG